MIFWSAASAGVAEEHHMKKTTMTVLEIGTKDVYVRLEGGEKPVSIWVPKDLLRHYGVKTTKLKVGDKVEGC